MQHGLRPRDLPDSGTLCEVIDEFITAETVKGAGRKARPFFCLSRVSEYRLLQMGIYEIRESGRQEEKGTHESFPGVSVACNLQPVAFVIS